MFYEVAAGHGLPHDPFKALVVPRPIGWITTLSARGEVNLSPYSFFNALSDRPHIVGFSSDGQKDAMTFAQETGEFVCNLATSAPLPRGTSELDHAGLAAAPSRLVRPPRVAQAPAALECRYLRTIRLDPLEGEGRYYLVLGQVVGVHVDDRFIVDGLVDTAAMRPIARAGYRDYFAATPETRFSITRPPGG